MSIASALLRIGLMMTATGWTLAAVYQIVRYGEAHAGTFQFAALSLLAFVLDLVQRKATQGDSPSEGLGADGE